jgi:hypothetical protein
LRHRIEGVGKRALEQSGKYRVNKNDEESFSLRHPKAREALTRNDR